jgi:hypothetical protein
LLLYAKEWRKIPPIRHGNKEKRKGKQNRKEKTRKKTEIGKKWEHQCCSKDRFRVEKTVER